MKKLIILIFIWIIIDKSIIGTFMLNNRAVYTIENENKERKSVTLFDTTLIIGDIVEFYDKKVGNLIYKNQLRKVK